MTEKAIMRLENYFFAIRTIAEASNNEYTGSIVTIADDALNYLSTKRDNADN